MVPAKCLLTRLDKQLLCEFQIKKQVFINLFKLNLKVFKNPLNKVLLHTKHQPFVCQFCNRPFAGKANKNSHKIICMQNPKQDDATWVASQKWFQCKFCNHKMVTNWQLTQHMRTHTKEKPFKCDTCDYSAAISGNLRKHIESKHNPNRLRNFACKLCPNSFYTKKDIYDHIRSNTKETSGDSACEFCKKEFLRKHVRNQHQIICKLNPQQNDSEWIWQQKKFRCELCDYASTVKGNLKKHIMSHTGQRPFKCSFCQYGTTTKENLHWHLIRHTKEKPHKCSHCNFKAWQKSQITYHVGRRHRRVKLG